MPAPDSAWALAGPPGARRSDADRPARRRCRAGHPAVQHDRLQRCHGPHHHGHRPGGQGDQGLARACAIAITPDGKTVYLAHYDAGLGDTVTPISTATNKADRDIRVGNGPVFVVITP